MGIHPTAVVDPRARIAPGCVIDPYTVIGPDVVVGEECHIGPHAVIDGWTRLGSRNRVCPFTTIGYPPQDVTYKGEETRVVVGDDNVIRENVTIHRGTARGRGVTTVGNGNLIMAYAHIAHDCLLGDSIVMANASLAGHVRIDDHASLGGAVVVHQFVRIGTHAFIGGKTGIGKDVPPYMLAAGDRAKLYGPNLVGLRRQNFPSQVIGALKKCYKILFRRELPFEEAVRRVREEVEPLPEVETLLDFLQNSKRGITR